MDARRTSGTVHHHAARVNFRDSSLSLFYNIYNIGKHVLTDIQCEALPIVYLLCKFFFLFTHLDYLLNLGIEITDMLEPCLT